MLLIVSSNVVENVKGTLQKCLDYARQDIRATVDFFINKNPLLVAPEGNGCFVFLNLHYVRTALV